MPNVHQNLDLKLAMAQTLPSTVITILSLCFSTSGLNQPAYAAGPIQRPSCEYPPAPPPQIPYPPNLNQVPINAPSFPPPGSGSASVGPGMPVQPPSCEYPPVPPPQIPYPPNLNQVPVNSPSFPAQPVQPYCPVNYGVLPYCPNQAVTVPGAGNLPGIGIPGNSIYGSPGTTTLMSPLVPGASFALPGMAAMQGAPPSIGSGYTPNPVNPGMTGQPPTFVPWTDGSAGNPQTHLTNEAVIPANQIDQPSNTVSMPYTNSTAQPPLSWKATVPASPSTPGADPGMLRQPAFSSGSTPAATTVQLGQNGQLTGTAPTTRSQQRGKSNDFGLSQKTPTPKQFFAYRMQVSQGPNGQTVVNASDPWKGLAGSTTQDFGIGVKQLAAAGLTGSKEPPQTAFDSIRPAQYPGGQNNTGTLNQNSKGNHSHNASPKGFANAQVTNDLYGVLMIRPNGTAPLTTIAPY